MFNPLQGVHAAQTLAQAIVNTLHEPFLVLDGDLRVLAASRSFYETFKVEEALTRDCRLYELGDGQWNIPALRLLLETIIPEHTAMDGFEVSHDFPGLGARTMLLNARKVIYDEGPEATILLAFTDVTARRAIEREKEELHARTEDLLRQQRVLLQEMEHRVANSLQIIASILMLKARAVTSEESRSHLKEAHQRVMSVAAVQSHLHASAGVERVEVGDYLSKLCKSLADSMIGDDRVALRVTVGPGAIGSTEAVSLGLIVTELVINAVKYAFPHPQPDATITVTFETHQGGWRLVVSDNGVGKGGGKSSTAASGLGTVIVQALVKQLGAQITVLDAGAGMSVAIWREAVSADLPAAA